MIKGTGSIQFLNIVDGLQCVIKNINSDFLLKILKLNPKIEFDVRRMTKEQICECIDSGHKEIDVFADYFDNPGRYEVDNYFTFTAIMRK